MYIPLADPFKFSEQHGEKVPSSASDSILIKLPQPDVQRDYDIMEHSILGTLESQQKPGKKLYTMRSSRSLIRWKQPENESEAILWTLQLRSDKHFCLLKGEKTMFLLISIF